MGRGMSGQLPGVGAGFCPWVLCLWAGGWGLCSGLGGGFLVRLPPPPSPLSLVRWWSFFFFFYEGSRTRDWVSVHMVSDRSTDAATICEWLAGQASGCLHRPAGCWMMGESLVNLQPGQGRAHPPSQHTPDNLQCLGSNPGLPGGIAWFPCFQTSCLIVTRWGCR